MDDAKARQRNRIRGQVDERYDAIVVGAGVGGLTTGALLAREGKKVLVLEHHYVAGGNATSFRRKDWEFDVGLHYVGECQPGGTLPKILAGCGAAPLRFRPMDAELEKLFMPGFEFSIPKDRREFERRLVVRYPEERKGLRRYFRFLEQCDKVVAANGGGSRFAKVWSILTSPLVVRWANEALGPFLDTCTENMELRALLTAQNGTYAIAPKRVSSVLHAGLCNHYFKSGGWYPEGGGQRLSDHLVDAIEAQGGHVRLRAPVSDIVVEGGRAVGVTFHNKHLGPKTVRADVIVSNADLKKTVADLVGREHFPEKYARKIEDFEMALPLYVVFLGVDVPFSELPYTNQNVWRFTDVDFDAEYGALCRGEMRDDPWIYIATASAKDPHNDKLAPEGHTNLEVMTVVPNKLSFWGVTQAEIDDGSYADNPAYVARKKQIDEACIAQAAAIIPGLEDHIVYSEGASPMTHSRYVRSTAGSCYGFSATPSQFLGHRPGAKSPIPGLYLCGTNCRAGHGIVGAMISGVQAAGAICGGDLEARVFSGKAKPVSLPRLARA